MLAHPQEGNILSSQRRLRGVTETRHPHSEHTPVRRILSAQTCFQNTEPIEPLKSLLAASLGSRETLTPDLFQGHSESPSSICRVEVTWLR